MENGEAAIQVLRQLKSLGAHIQIDDFGTGYSSLAYLSRLPVDGLKIDQTFVQRMMQPGKETEIIRSIMALAEATGLEVVAEGIESEGQLTALREFGCEQGQGYYYSPPLSLVATEGLLNETDHLPRESAPRSS